MKRYVFLDLGKVNEAYAGKLKKACAEVIDSGRYIGGEEVEALEQEIAAYCGTAHCVGTGNGLDALRLILAGYRELGRLKEGDEIIVPANTFIATVLAITDMGFRPVFVEPDERSFNLDASLIEKALTPGTRAIMTVHLYGNPAYSELLRSVADKHGLLLLEDSAQAIGAHVDGKRCGALGDAAAFSFYPTKNLGALGDGGAVTTDDAQLAQVVRALRNYGSIEQYHNIYRGYNSRLDPIQAAMLRIKLQEVDAENAGRRALAGIYSGIIHNHAVVLPEDSPGHVYHQYAVRVKDRERFRRYLLDRGVETAVHYPVAPIDQECYREYKDLDMPVTRKLAREVVSLPISPACTSLDDARDISNIINDYTE